jgi:DNA-binding MarR family transcriptional regulator
MYFLFVEIVFQLADDKNICIFSHCMDTTEILIKIRKIVRSVDIESKKIQKEYGVSIPQVLCLNFLRDSKNYQSSQGEIRKFLNLNSSTVSGIINRLERKGYLARLPKSGDKRVVNIALTSAGDTLLSKMPSLLHEQLSEKLAQLDAGLLQQVEKGLETLVTIMDIEKVNASPMLTMEEDLEESFDNPDI